MKEHNGIIIWNLIHELFKFNRRSYHLPTLTELETRIMHITAMHRKRTGESINISQLKIMLNVSHPTISQTVSSLEERDYIKRVKDPDDKRITRVEISKAGKEVLDKAFEIVSNTFINMADYIGQEKSTEFIQTLEQIIQYFKEIGGQE